MDVLVKDILEYPLLEFLFRYRLLLLPFFLFGIWINYSRRSSRIIRNLILILFFFLFALCRSPTLKNWANFSDQIHRQFYKTEFPISSFKNSVPSYEEFSSTEICSGFFILDVIKMIRIGQYNTSYQVRATRIPSESGKRGPPGTFKVILYCKNELEANSRVLVMAALKSPRDSPYGEFSMLRYCKSFGAMGSMKLIDPKISYIKRFDRNPLHSWREAVSEAINSIFQNAKTQALIRSFLLGDKTQLDANVYESFRKAGAAHVLAVSGLHVGIVFLLFQSALKRFFSRFFKPYNSIGNSSELTGIAACWLFAGLSGFGPSVLRACFMLSLLKIGPIWKRKGIALNSLAASAMLLLILQPHFYHKIGFQLSYAAVLGIILFHRPIRALFAVHSRLGKWVADLFALSISAQIGSTALVVLHFQQFSFSFLLSNLVLVPFIGFVLGLSILGIIIYLLHCPPTLLHLLDKVIEFPVRWITIGIEELASWPAMQQPVEDAGWPFVIVWIVACILLYRYLNPVSETSSHSKRQGQILLWKQYLCMFLVLQFLFLASRKKSGATLSMERVKKNEVPTAKLQIKKGRYFLSSGDSNGLGNPAALDLNYQPLNPYLENGLRISGSPRAWKDWNDP
jgi:ComEC/Rec2-related protein